MRTLLAALFPFLLASSLSAQLAPSIDVRSMLDGLKKLKQVQTTAAHSQLAQAIGDFSDAASSDASALAFYLEAVRVTQFVGQNREQTAFRDWKKKEEPKLNAPAIRECLRYTAISLQRAAGATDKQIFPLLLEYAQDAGSMLTGGTGQEILHQPITGNIFTKWYNLGDTLAGLDNWEPIPGNVDGIYEKVLLPMMRQNRDPRIIDYWDAKINSETAAAAAATAAFSTDRFNQDRRPELLWSRAEDTIAIGGTTAGITQMYTIIKSFPTHRSAGKWIDELQNLLLPPPAVTGTAPAPAGAPAPATRAPALGAPVPVAPASPH